MRKLTLIAATAALTAGSFTVAAPAEARHRQYERGYHQGRDDARYGSQGYYGRSQRYQGQRGYRCKSGTTGAIVGGAAGALLGREVIGRGDRTLGTVLGGAAGALLGREITRTKGCR